MVEGLPRLPLLIRGEDRWDQLFGALEVRVVLFEISSKFAHFFWVIITRFYQFLAAEKLLFKLLRLLDVCSLSEGSRSQLAFELKISFSFRRKNRSQRVVTL